MSVTEQVIVTLDRGDPTTEQIIVTVDRGEIVALEVGLPGPPGAQGPVGPPGPAGASHLSGLSDVDLSNKLDGSLLSYDANTEKWRATRVMRENLVDGGNF